MQKGKISELETRIKQLEEQLELRAKENEKFTESFVANLSHEIRTPLNAIVGFSGLLKTRELSDSKKEQFLIHISNSSERLLYLIDNIMELSYYQSNSLKLKEEICNVAEILKSALYYVNHLKEKHIKNSVAIICNDPSGDDTWNFYSDEFRILLVLRNLLNNALKYTEQGYIEFGCQVKNNELEFYVKDTGKGINSLTKSVFENFYKNEQNYLTSKHGLGIGLSVCKGIIEKMQGNIWYSKNEQNGTTFYFTVPYRRAKTAINTDQKSTVCIS